MSDWVGSLGKDKDCVEMGVDRDAVYLWDQENAWSATLWKSLFIYENPSYTANPGVERGL